MPFIALEKETGARIDITQVQAPKTVYKRGDCLCQLCGAPLYIKGGPYVRDHFAHETACESDFQYHPETPEHRMGKLFLATHLREDFPEYRAAKVELEVPIPRIKRVADILVTFPTGWQQAHEIQLASITTEQLQERTDDYARAGIDVVWWLGKTADTPVNRAWCIDTFGYCFSLSVSNRTTHVS